MPLLTEEQLLHFRDRLEKRRNSILRVVKDVEREGLDLNVDQIGEISRIKVHPADLGTEEATRDVSLNLAGQGIMQIQEIEAALNRIQNHTYGICERCGKDIDLARLEAMPETRYCIECGGRMETSAPTNI